MQPPEATTRKKSTSTTYSQSALERPINSKRSPSARMFFWFLRKNAKERHKPPSVREMLVQFPLQFNFVGKESNAKPPQSDLRSSSSPCSSTSLARERCKTPSVRANARPAPPTRLSLRSCRQGERCIPNDISRYKRIIRVYR